MNNITQVCKCGPHKDIHWSDGRTDVQHKACKPKPRVPRLRHKPISILKGSDLPSELGQRILSTAAARSCSQVLDETHSTVTVFTCGIW